MSSLLHILCKPYSVQKHIIYASLQRWSEIKHCSLCLLAEGFPLFPAETEDKELACWQKAN